MKKLILPLLFPVMLMSTSCSGQENDNKDTIPDIKTSVFMKNRKPVVAGQFYAGTESQLRSDLKGYFADAVPKKSSNVTAIISPHAGYVYSGEVAASSFNQVDNGRKYEHIFVIASSHRVLFGGASIYYLGNYETPLGEVKVDTDFAGKLIRENKIFEYKAEAHSLEHSLEVQLPFLQYIMESDYSIIPIVMGTQSVDDCREVARVLKPYFNEKNLFIISTDFSHYPAYDDALIVDSLTAEGILSNKPETFLAAIKSNEKKNIENLSTSLCGWTSVLTLLYMTEGNTGVSYKKIQYKNSGDTRYGDHDRVVGYCSIVAEYTPDTTKKSSFLLSEKDRDDLLEIARKTIDTYIKDKKIYQLTPDEYSDALHEKCGAFVTLHKDGKLRGCIGRFEPDDPLYKVVQSMAISSATEDRRFDVVTEDELDDIEIEISVLTPLLKIDTISQFELGKHGIYMKKGYSRGTFLPQVAKETGWTTEEFLGHCARDKAGIGWTGWKDAELFTYEAIIFSEKKKGKDK